MPVATRGGLYIASWEHLYLFPAPGPSGLPSQLFFRHPWMLILFEHLYCDSSALNGELKVANLFGWTNSELFVRLYEEFNIIIPLPMRKLLDPDIEHVNDAFKNQHGMPIEKAISNELISHDKLFHVLFHKWRLTLLKPFLKSSGLTLYDWSIARAAEKTPFGIEITYTPWLDIVPVPLSKELPDELSKEGKETFDKIRAFEEEYIQELRLGQVSHDDYLQLLIPISGEHRKIDMELAVDIEPNLNRILRIRNRFGTMGGWNLIQDYLNVHYSRPLEGKSIRDDIQIILDQCFRSEGVEFKSVVQCNIANVSPGTQVPKGEDTSTIKAIVEGTRAVAPPCPPDLTVTPGWLHNYPDETGAVRPPVEGMEVVRHQDTLYLSKTTHLLKAVELAEKEARKHPGAEILDLYSLYPKRLSEEVRESTRIHLMTCQRCRAQVDEGESRADYFRRLEQKDCCE